MTKVKKSCDNCIYCDKENHKCTNIDYLTKRDYSNKPYCKWYSDHEPTRYEKIKSMSIHEIADFLDKISNRDREDSISLGCYDCIYFGTHHQPEKCVGCKWENGILGWLNS